MDKKVEKYYNHVTDVMVKNTYLDVPAGTIGYPNSKGRGYFLIGDMEYDLSLMGPHIATRYGARGEDIIKILQIYKRKIMEKVWDTDNW